MRAELGIKCHLWRCEVYEASNKPLLGGSIVLVISSSRLKYPGCQRLVSRSHLSHITRLLCLLYFRPSPFFRGLGRSLPASGRPRLFTKACRERTCGTQGTVETDLSNILRVLHYKDQIPNLITTNRLHVCVRSGVAILKQTCVTIIVFQLDLESVSN